MSEPLPDAGVIAIVRLSEPAPLQVLHALARGGISHVEVTLTTPGCLESVAAWRSVADGVQVGVGSIRSAADVTASARAGAQFLVTPGTHEDVLRAARSFGLPTASGAATPTEMISAIQWGATWVKVFPANRLGGPDYIRDIRAPLPDLPLVPTGGVDVHGARRYAALGCAGVGVGSHLVDPTVVADRDWKELERRARALSTAWREGSA